MSHQSQMSATKTLAPPTGGAAPRGVRSVLLGTVSAACVTACLCMWAFRAPAHATTIAVVDLEKVYNNLDQHKVAETALDAKIKELEAAGVQREQDVKAVKAELDLVKGGTDAYLETQRKVEAAVGKLLAWEDFCKMKTTREQTRIMKQTYDDIKAACALIAAEMNIDLVLLDDATPKFPENDPRPMNQQISARRTLFVNTDLDITQTVLDRMNADFKKKAAGPAGP